MNSQMMKALSEAAIAATLVPLHAVMILSTATRILDGAAILAIHQMITEDRIVAIPKDMTINPIVVDRLPQVRSSGP